MARPTACAEVCSAVEKAVETLQRPQTDWRSGETIVENFSGLTFRVWKIKGGLARVCFTWNISRLLRFRFSASDEAQSWIVPRGTSNRPES
jgi:hypothetical protein